MIIFTNITTLLKESVTELKKILLTSFLTLVLASCGTPESGIKEVDSVPEDIHGLLNDFPNAVFQSSPADLRLVSFNDGDNGSYIVFHSSGEVEAHTESEDSTLVIHLTETETDEAIINQFTYYLTTSEEHDTIQVRVNDEPIPFDLRVAM